MSDNDALIERASSISGAASKNGATIRLLGGVAVAILCKGVYDRYPGLQRSPHDIDFMGYSKQSHRISSALNTIGVTGDQRFNALYGDLRLKFYDKVEQENTMIIDVFLDRFKQSHEIPMKGRLEISHATIPPTDLLMTKLQIWEINRKDILDITALLAAYELKESGGANQVELDRIADLTSDDWGLWKTSIRNLKKVGEFLDSDAEAAEVREDVVPKLAQLNQVLTEAKKSLKWKMRSIVGEKVPWYETPEEV